MRLYDRLLSRSEAATLLDVLSRHADGSPGDRLLRIYAEARRDGDISPRTDDEARGLRAVLRSAVMARQQAAIVALLGRDHPTGEQLARDAAVAWALLNHVTRGASRAVAREK